VDAAEIAPAIHYNGEPEPAAIIMPPSTYRHDLLRKRLAVFTRALQGVEEGDVRALHRARVASRRLREILPVLQLERSATRKLVKRLRKVTARLGTVRELDVLSLHLEELQSRRDEGDAVRHLASAVGEERKSAREQLRDKLPISDLQRLAARLDEVAASLERHGGPARARDEAASRWALDARVARRAERLNDAMRRAGAVYLADRLHNVRVAVKKLRYAVELRNEFAGNGQTEDLRVLKRVQEALGRMHDLQMMMDRARRVQAALPPSDAAAWDQLDTLIDGIEDDCRRLHARYMRERPALLTICAQAVARPHAVAVRRAAPRRAARRQIAS
jgi:CHAD domain-containing protein